MSGRVSVSANEYCVTVAKACVARGVERSVAREIALACCVLENAGVPALPLLLTGLDTLDDDAPVATWREAGAFIEGDAVRVLRDGCAAVDLVPAYDEVHISCDLPALMAGLALVHGVQIEVQGRDGWTALQPVQATNEPAALRLSRGDAPVEPRGPIVFRNAAWWRRIEDVAKGILVPASDATRADAGAGTTDND